MSAIKGQPVKAATRMERSRSAQAKAATLQRKAERQAKHEHTERHDHVEAWLNTARPEYVAATR